MSSWFNISPKVLVVSFIYVFLVYLVFYGTVIGVADIDLGWADDTATLDTYTPVNATNSSGSSQDDSPVEGAVLGGASGGLLGIGLAWLLGRRNETLPLLTFFGIPGMAAFIGGVWDISNVSVGGINPDVVFASLAGLWGTVSHFLGFLFNMMTFRIVGLPDFLGWFAFFMVLPVWILGFIWLYGVVSELKKVL